MTYIIAEAGVNHNGDLSLALQLVDQAAIAGADAIKFQTFVAEELVSERAETAEYQKRNLNKDISQLEMLKQLQLTKDMHVAIQQRCVEKGIEFLSTPFDLKSLQLLIHEFNMKTIKISSGDIDNAPLLLEAARSGVDIILSTGMSTIGDVENALMILTFGYSNSEGNPSQEAMFRLWAQEDIQTILQQKVTILHCTSDYPAAYEDVHLNVLHTLRQTFSLPVGYSDHTEGIEVAIAAVAKGATVIEKHFTLDKSLPGPDHIASLNVEELTMMIKCIRNVERALGMSNKIITTKELATRTVARKSIVANEEIKQGQLLSGHNITVKRPANGKSPMLYWDVVGTTAAKDIKKDEPI